MDVFIVCVWNMSRRIRKVIIYLINNISLYYEIIIIHKERVKSANK